MTATGPNTVCICTGVFLSSLKGVDSSADMYIKGKSSVRVNTNTTDGSLNGSYSTYRYVGSGIWSGKLGIQAGAGSLREKVRAGEKNV